MCFVPVDCAFADIAEDITVPERNAGLAMTEHACMSSFCSLSPTVFCSSMPSSSELHGCFASCNWKTLPLGFQKWVVAFLFAKSCLSHIFR